MASNSSSICELWCQNCKENFDEVNSFPCLHEFCLKCTNKMTNGAKITCLVCSIECHQGDIKKKYAQRQLFLFKEEDSVSTFSEISLHSEYGQDVTDNKKEELVFCEKHKQSLSIYCKICDDIICHTCCWTKEHFYHAKPENLETNLEKVFTESTSDINKKISKMEDIIKNQNTMIQENQNLQKKFLKNYDEVRTAIEKYASELKDHIDVIKNAMILQINSIQNQLLKSITKNINKIEKYINSLAEKKSYYTDVITNESNMYIFNLKRELSKNGWIENKLEKEIKTIEVTFEKPSLEKMISSELLKSFKVDCGQDLKILSLKNVPYSTCIFNDKFYTVYHKDNIINMDLYDKETLTYNTPIDFKPNITNKINRSFIVNTLNNLFLYYRFESDKHTYICKLRSDNKTFVEWKTLEEHCEITSTYQQTLLVRLASRQLIELSENGDELKRIKIPDAAVLPLPYYYNYDHQLKDGRYVVTSYDNKSVIVSLLDTERTIIKSFTQQSTDIIKTCTDGEKYIFVLEWNVGKITVLSTNFQYLHEFSYPGVKQIHYDKVNNKILLVKQKEIIYFTYYLGKLF